jgi:hypothetical protein
VAAASGNLAQRVVAGAVLTVAALAVGLALGLAAGGRPRYLARRRIRWWWLLVAGLLLQVAAGRVGSPVAATAAFVAAYACLLAFVYANRLLVGTGVIAAGLVMNAAVVAVDGGMPVSPPAIVAAGLSPPGLPVLPPADPKHHLQRPGDHLTFLDDRDALPWGHQVVSAGDLVLALGLGDTAFHLTQPAGTAARRRRTGGHRRVRRCVRSLWGWLGDMVVQPAAADAVRVDASYYGAGRQPPRRPPARGPGHPPSRPVRPVHQLH